MIASFLAAAVMAAPFNLVQSGSRWQFRSKEGHTFWSLGVCCTETGVGWEEYDPKNPSYAAHKLFPNSKAWVDHTLGTLRSNGFTSIGGWSGTDLFRKHGGKERLPYFEVLHLAAYNDGAPWRDMFTKENAWIIDKAAKDQILKIKNDPYLVGYFSDNELGWWREALFVTYLKMGKKEPGKIRFVDFIRTYYKNSLSRFQQDWTGNVRSFSQIDSKIKLRPGGKGMHVVKAWQTYLTGLYYRQMKAVIRKYDPQRLILGDRYCQFYYPNVAQAAAPHVDAISTNYGADWNNGQNTEYFLSSLHQLTKKPVLITEFYMAAMENRSGNKNSSGGFPVVQTQREREEAVRTYLTDVGRRPYVVGAHWFQYYDEPEHGRGDGENYNMGLVDIHGQPYDGLMRVFKGFKPGKTWAPAYNAHLPLITSTLAKQLKSWPKAESLIKPGPEAPFGDLYLLWDGASLYVGLASMGFTDEVLYPNKRIPEADRSELKFTLNGQSHWVRFGGVKRQLSMDSGLQVVNWRDGVRNELIVKLRAPRTHRIALKATLTTHGKADRMTWSDNRELVSTK